MSAIELQGLPVFHPAAALATYGLYAMIPDARIHYKFGRGYYYPVLESKFDTIEELSEFLSDPLTWQGIPPDQAVADLNYEQYFLEEYLKLVKVDPELASGIGTDMKLVPAKKPKPGKRVGISVSRSPFFSIDLSQWKFYEQFNAVKDMVVGNPQKVSATLTGYPWTRQVGQNFGFFFDSIAVSVFKNILTKSGSKKKTPATDKGTTTTVPVICMLAVASWKVLPCFVYNRSVTTAGWHTTDKKTSFYYPVFTKPQTKDEALSWLNNPALLDLPKNRTTWRKMGIAGLYKTTKLRYSKGGGYITAATSL